MKPLSAKQETFCLEFLKDKNASQAYIRAGYAPIGANAKAARLISNDRITARINELLEERNNELKVDARWVLEQAMDCFKECREAGDHQNAKTYLDMCGKHVEIMAFKESKEVTGAKGGAIEHNHNVKFA